MVSTEQLKRFKRELSQLPKVMQATGKSAIDVVTIAFVILNAIHRFQIWEEIAEMLEELTKRHRDNEFAQKYQPKKMTQELERILAESLVSRLKE